MTIDIKEKKIEKFGQISLMLIASLLLFVTAKEQSLC